MAGDVPPEDGVWGKRLTAPLFQTRAPTVELEREFVILSEVLRHHVAPPFRKENGSCMLAEWSVPSPLTDSSAVKIRNLPRVKLQTVWNGRFSTRL